MAERTAGEAADRPAGCMAHYQVLRAEGVLVEDDGRPVDFDDLPLRDAHALRALLAYAGIVPEEPGGFTCANCDAPFEVAPSPLLEVGPFVDGELDDPELDAPFDFDRTHEIAPLRVARGTARNLRLAPRTVGEALPLWRAAEAPSLRLTPAVVIAMGVVAMGRERRSSAIAEALARAPEDAWQDVVALFNEAHYPARLVALHRCAECGSRNDLDVPLERELPLEASPLRDVGPEGPPSRGGRAGEDTFPDLDAFEARVRGIAERVYGDRGIKNVGLFIDAGVAACDDGGEPLLGSYTPGALEGELTIPEPPEIRLYYRTFAAMHAEDGPYDLDEEIRETIDHEVTHHLNHMSGSDPLDDEELAEIGRETARRVGKSEGMRRAGRGALADLAGFWRATWPVWLIALAGTLLALCADLGGRR
jgi:hypothetical protein